MMKNYKKANPFFRLRKIVTPVLMGLLFSFNPGVLSAQVVLSTAAGTNYTGANGVAGDASVTFVIENNSNDPYLFMDLDVYWQTANNNAMVELWYSSTSLSGAATVSSPVWTNIASGGPIAVPANGYYPTLSNIAFMIPANTTYRFALRSSNGIRYSGASPVPAPNSFSQSGVSLHSGGHQINSSNIGYGGAFPTPTNQPRWFTGSVTLVLAEGTDLAVSEFLEPVASCAGSSTVKVAVQNVGGDSITSATVAWRLNGVFQGTANYTGILYTGDTAHVALGGFTAVSGVLYDIEAYITNVGPGIDSNKVNDTLIKVGYRSALDGVYTINAGAPASLTNFQSFSEAVNALNNFGVCGPVVFNVAPNSGPYSERVVINEIAGASATNNIIFNGAGNVLEYSAPNTDDRTTLMLDGADYISIDSLRIEANGTSWAWVMQLMNDADHNTFTNCEFIAPTNSTSTLISNVVMSGSPTGAVTSGSTGSHNTFQNNYHEGGYYAITVMGASTTVRGHSNKIHNSVFKDFYLYGIYISNQEDMEVVGNDLSRMGRATTSTFYGIYVTQTAPGLYVARNAIHDIANTGATTTAAYPIYLTASGGTPTSPARFENNAVYNINNNGIQYGAYMLGTTNDLEFYHNSIILDNPNQTGASTLACFYHTGAAAGIDLKNNIFHINNSNTGTQYNIWFSNASAAMTTDNNVLYNSNSSGITARLGTTNYNSLADWQLVNSGAYDQNSVAADPVFAGVANGNITPMSGAINGIGTPLGITIDLYGNTRSATVPDPGSVEFVPVNADVALVDGGMLKGECLSTNDTVYLTIRNTIGTTINLAVDTVVAFWEITGPMTSNGTVSFNNGSLPVDAEDTKISLGADLSVPGIYTLHAYIELSSVNESATNDTLTGIVFEVRPVFSVSPSIITVTNDQDSVEISALSPFLPGGDLFITEICHFKTTNGQPTGGWPAYLLADDYIEVTGVPNSDLGGITLEQWNASTMLSSHTFPAGTVLSPLGTAVIAVGEMGSSVPSPANYYYHGNGTYTGSFGSTTVGGRILKDVAGTIIDAVVYGNMTFPAAAGVTAADWSGTTPSVSSSGNRLEGAYTKDATNWTNSGSAGSNNGQNPNAVNQNVVVPTPSTLTGFSWSIEGSVIDTNSSMYVGPFSVPGTYYYVAAYNTPCGILTDSVEVFVNFPYCSEADSIMFTDGCTDVDVSWTVGMFADHHTSIEFGVAGFTQGTGRLISGAMSPTNLDSLTPGTSYDVYVIDSCSYDEMNSSSQAVSMATITSEYNLSPTTSSLSSCYGELSVVIPTGATIYSVDVEYDVLAGNGAYMSEQLNYVRCVSPGGVAESSISTGAGSSAGLFSYNRTGLTIANGVTGTDTIKFELHSFRNWGGAACDPVYNDVVPGSFKITVHHDTTITTVQFGESMAMGTFTTKDMPNAVGFTYSDLGGGNFDFVADTNAIGDLRWNFGDGNAATGGNVSHQYASPGTYTVMLIADNDCGSDTISQTVINSSVDMFGITNVAIYPNPNTGVFTIDNLPVDGGDVLIRMNDMQGRTIFSRIYQQHGHQRLDMNAEHLRAGTYYLTISNDLGQVTKPVVLVR